MNLLAPPLNATLEDLYAFDGKAELIDGRIVPQMATGHRPNQVAGRIYRSLGNYLDVNDIGFAYTDNIGFVVPRLPSGRRSFSPDAAFYRGTPPNNPMRFIEGAPTFAVEVRSENDYGDAAEEAIAAKRADYFLAGTLVVWDVDPMGRVILCYRGETVISFGVNAIADAEPAVPGWSVSVAWLMV